MNNWYEELDAAVTICDLNGKIIEINRKAANTFQKWGGKKLIGKSIFACHNPNSQKIISQLMAENKSNTYTIEKDGIKKLIFQSPWYREGEVAGLVELSIPLPKEMPHFVRV